MDVTRCVTCLDKGFTHDKSFTHVMSLCFSCRFKQTVQWSDLPSRKNRIGGIPIKTKRTFFCPNRGLLILRTILAHIYWAPKETIHCRYLKLVYSKHETLTFVVRNVILDVLTHSFFFLQIMDFRQRCWCWPTNNYVWVNLQTNKSTEGSLFLHLNPLWMKTLE